MTQLEEALARFDRLIHSPAHQDLAWAKQLQEKMAAQHLMPGGRALCPVLRPHLIARRQYDALVKTAEVIHSVFARVTQMALVNPAILNRLELLPAEKMLAGVDPGYATAAAATSLGADLTGGGVHITRGAFEGPTSVPAVDLLTDLFYDSPPLKEFRKKHKLSKFSGSKRFLHSLLTAYKPKAKKKFPRIGIVEFHQSLKAGPSNESLLLAEHLRRAGYPTEVVTPEQLEYRNGVLSRGDFGMEIVYRRVSAQELLVRLDLNHALLRAYREGTVCVVNSFRAELASKQAIFALLCDEAILAQFPAAERKIIREHIPWTRMVAAVKTTRNGKTIDLPEYVANHRASLVLRPNDSTGDLQTYIGADLEQPVWERAVKSALHNPYVVQERPTPALTSFPVLQFGRLEVRQMRAEVRPNLFLGKMDGASAEVVDATSSFSLLTGTAPVMVLESAS